MFDYGCSRLNGAFIRLSRNTTLLQATYRDVTSKSGVAVTSYDLKRWRCRVDIMSDRPLTADVLTLS